MRQWVVMVVLSFGSSSLAQKLTVQDIIGPLEKTASDLNLIEQNLPECDWLISQNKKRFEDTRIKYVSSRNYLDEKSLTFTRALFDLYSNLNGLTASGAWKKIDGGLLRTYKPTLYPKKTLFYEIYLIDIPKTNISQAAVCMLVFG